MTHISNVHTHLIETVLQDTERESIVEVLRIVRVDGAGEDLTEVLTFCIILWSDLSRDFVCRLLHILRIFIRQTILCKNGVHLRVVLATLSKNSDHLTNNMPTLLLRPFHNLHNHLLSFLRLVKHSLRNNDVTIRMLTLRSHISRIVLYVHGAHKLRLLPFQDFRNNSLADMMVSSRHHRDTHTVSIKSIHRVSLCHKNLWLVGTVWLERVLSRTLSDERTLHCLTL